nr:hypothetical protein [Tanacetum cinerariifolium]
GKVEEGGATESLKATKGTKPKAAKATKPVGDKETPGEPSPSKRSKGGLVGTIRKPRSPLKLVDEPSAEDVPVEEPAYNEEEANGKEKVVDEQAAHDLLTLLTPKNKSTVDQFIFQRRTPMLTEASGHAESPSLDAELAMTDGETESDNAGLNPGVQDEGQAGSNLGDAAKSQPQSSHVVHVGPNQFTTTAYPNVQENLKLPYEDPVILKEPVSSTGTLSSLQNLKKELSFTDQFFVEKQVEFGSPLPTSTATTSAVMTTTTLPPPPPQPQQSSADPTLLQRIVDEIVTDAVDWAMQAPLRARFSDLPAVDIKEILQQRIPTPIRSGRSSPEEKKETCVPRTPSGSLPPQPPPPPPPVGASGALSTSGASRSSPLPPLSPPPSTNVENNWATALVSAYETPAENSLLAKTGDMTNFLNWYCRQVDWTNPEGDQVRVDVNRPLPLGGPPGHVTIQTQFFFNKDLECLRYGSKGSSPALLISKMKAASYRNFGLELPMSEQIADLQEHTIAKKDFKNLYPSDFEDLNLLLLQGHLDHLPGFDKRMLSTAFKLWTRNLVIRQRSQGIQDQAAQSGYEYAILDSKGCDKEQRVHSGYLKATEDEKDLQNLECFVVGRVRDIDYGLLQRTE